jgi:long-chain acyl-CoA synthetase
VNQPQTLFQVLTATAQAMPKQVAISQDGVNMTYASLHQHVQQLALALLQSGISPGDRVALLLSNQAEFMVSFLAIVHCGAVVVPLNLQGADTAYVLAHSAPRLLITTHSLVSKLPLGLPIPMWVANAPMPDSASPATPEKSWIAYEAQLAKGASLLASGELLAVPNNTLADALRVLIYTSGTTGQSKGVMLSEGNLLGNLAGVETALDVSSSDHLLLALPLFHVFGLIIALLAIRFGATLVLAPSFTPKALLGALTSHPITVLPLVPTMFGMLLQGFEKMPPQLAQQALGQLRFCISGGAALPPQLHHTLQQRFGVTVLEGYGLTEASAVVAVNRLVRGAVPGSVGLPLDNITVTLAEDGEVLLKGPNVMLGYYQNPEETAMALTEDGWLRTGDLGHWDDAGNLCLSSGRKKDLIIKAGENLAPVKIEAVLYQHPAVQEASVIGLPDDRLGERILACVQLKPEAPLVSERDLLLFCKDHLPAFWVPDVVRFYEALPKTPTGKILKKALRADNPGQQAVA